VATHKAIPKRAPPHAPIDPALDRAQARWKQLKLTVAAAFLAGLALSPRLWAGSRVFPMAPVFGWWPALPASLDSLLYAAMLALLAGIALVARPLRWITAFAAVFAVMAVADQMRWQPWAYQYLWLLAALAWGAHSAHRTASVNACRLVLACTYFWSGLQKVNSDFVTAVFPVFVQGLPAPFSRLLAPTGWAIAALEAALGIGLLVPRLRRVAVAGAVAMHVTILIALGPWGSSFNSVVWPWNLAMIAFVWILFQSSTESARIIVWPHRGWFPKLALAMLGLVPALSLFNAWDAYLSFALYSGVNNIDYLRVSDALAARLPVPVQAYVAKTSTPGVNQLRLVDWSYAELNVPMNAEPRVYRAIARELCQYEREPEELQLFVFPRHRLRPGQKRLGYGCADLKN
jgi:DoxX